MTEAKDILTNIKKWVKEAGKEQISRNAQSMEITQKSAAIDLVTEVDVWTEEFFVEKIKATYPSHSILSEESGRHIGDANTDYEWVIDPIDGTTNFAHRFPIFCISVGVKYKSKAIIGVIYVPKLDELYEAVRGEGAYLNGNKISVSEIKSLSSAVVGTGFPYDRATSNNNNVDNFSAIVTKVAGIRRTGSAAFDLCQVATGRFDGFWEIKLNDWDIEAGILIVQEAGGKVIRQEGEKGIFVLASNPAIFEEMQQYIQSY